MAKNEKVINGLAEAAMWFDLAGMKKLRGRVEDGIKYLLKRDGGGYWIDMTAPDGPEEYRCSVCGYTVEMVDNPKKMGFLYCPHCGAGMD